MSVKLRLRRMGKKKQPFYRVVAADSRAPRDGRFIELIGTYNPIKRPYTVELKEDRILFWLNQGAQPTRTVLSLLRHKGLWMKWDLIKRGADESKISEEMAKWEVLQLERIKRLAEKPKTRKAKKKATKPEEATAAIQESTGTTGEVKADVPEEKVESAPSEKEESKS